MVLTPLLMAASRFIVPKSSAELGEAERPDGLTGSVLVIGFGRVGQIVSQLLLTRGHDISIIDTDVEMINVAREFDFKVYYGDGRRLDILHAAGAGEAKAVVVCIDEMAATTEIVELVKAEFPLASVLARSSDRRHALELMKKGVSAQVRETFESAIVLGKMTLEALGVDALDAEQAVDRVRARDSLRLELEMVGGMYAGRSLFSGSISATEQTSEIDPDLSRAGSQAE